MKKKLGETYYYYKFRKIGLFLVFLGALNWGGEILGFNFLDAWSQVIQNRTGFNIRSYLYLLISLCAIILYMDKSVWTPFLDNAVLPCPLINKEPPKDASMEIKVKTKPNKKIAYWASNTNDELINVWDAYGDYSNSGVVTADKKGIAICKIRKPSGYLLPNGSSLSPHLHYRECPDLDDAEGMMGDVKTIFLKNIN